jgi:ketosteroid isomerase-like protein
MSVSILAVLALCMALPEGSTVSRVEEIIKQRELAWNAAIKARDVEQAGSFQTEDYFLGVGRPGADVVVFPRKQWLEVLPGYVITEMRLGEMAVRVYGNTATAAYGYFQAATSHGDDLTGDYLILDVWREEGGAWNIAARYSARFSRTHAQNEQMGQPKVLPSPGRKDPRR